MLTNAHIQTVKSTLPLLESANTQITDYFYHRLFHHNPELKHVFNLSNQQSGRQSKALFSAIAAYAKHIDNVDSLKELVFRIANKHVSLNVQAHHYDVVGHHLIETLRELLQESFTRDIEEAWTQAYNTLAGIFIQQESQLYKEKETSIGGWNGERKFRVTSIHIESEHVKSFILTPTDGKPVLEYKAGQYIGVRVQPEDHPYQEIRQYSLSTCSNGNSYRISVKREAVSDEKSGAVSNYLHDDVNVDDELEVYPPTGDFFLVSENKPVVLVSAGVGLTPMQAMLETLAREKYQEPVFYLHACDNKAQHSFAERVEQLSDRILLTQYTWYNNDESNHQKNIFTGLMNLCELKACLPVTQGDFYLCGPIAFMKHVKQQLLDIGVRSDNIYYEVFGPHDDF